MDHDNYKNIIIGLIVKIEEHKKGLITYLLILFRF